MQFIWQVFIAKMFWIFAMWMKVLKYKYYMTR